MYYFDIEEYGLEVLIPPLPYPSLPQPRAHTVPEPDNMRHQLHQFFVSLRIVMEMDVDYTDCCL